MLDFFKGTVTPRDWAFVAVVLAIAGLLAVGFYFLVYQRQVETLASVQSTLDAKTTELENAKLMHRQIDERRELAETADAIVLNFEKRLPEKREIPALLRQIDQNADRQSLKVELYPMDTRIEKDKETIPYEIIAYGKFHDIVQFINELETDKRFLKVSNLEIGEQQLETGFSEASFQLSTFRFIQTEAPDVANNE